jgi:hypothetical protein
MNPRIWFRYVLPTLIMGYSSLLQLEAQQNPEGDAIRESVIRCQMEDWIHGGDQSERHAKTATEKAVAKEMNFRIFFVSISGKDPTDALMNQLHDIPRIVKKVSSSKINKQFRMAVVDRATGQRGIIFRADEIHWLDKNSVEVEGGYVCDGLCGLGETFKLHRSNNKWIVTGRVVHWIS